MEKALYLIKKITKVAASQAAGAHYRTYRTVAAPATE